MIQQLKKYFRNPGWNNTMGMWWGSILYWGTFKSVIPCLGPSLRPVKLGSLGCVAWALESLKNLHEILMLCRVENYWSFLFFFFSFHLGNILWIPSMHMTLLGFCYSARLEYINSIHPWKVGIWACSSQGRASVICIMGGLWISGHRCLQKKFEVVPIGTAKKIALLFLFPFCLLTNLLNTTKPFSGKPNETVVVPLCPAGGSTDLCTVSRCSHRSLDFFTV